MTFTSSSHLPVDVPLSEAGLVRRRHVLLHEGAPSQHRLLRNRGHSGRKFKRSPAEQSPAGPSQRVHLGEAAA